MARRLGILALLVGFGAVAYWAVQMRTADDGDRHVVHVLVLDEHDQPVRGAQVRRRLSQASWETVDGAGRITLRDVPLHAGHTPSPDSLAAALSVRARFLGVRDAPDVQQRDEGWQVTYRLAPHGVLRLTIEPTHLAPLKAWIEPDPLGRFEAMGTTNVARLDQDAAFRILPGLDEVMVRVEGEPDPLGTIRVATQRLVFPAPRPGVVTLARVKATPALPISGLAQKETEDGPRPVFGPSVEILVRTIEDDKPARELGRVPVTEKSGRFIIPFTGRGPYALTLHAPLRQIGPMRVAAGDSEVLLFAGDPRAWVRFAHPEMDPKRRKLTIALVRPDGDAPRVVGTLRRERTWTRVTFADKPGVLTFHARVPGTNREPPLEATGEIQVAGAGETKATLDLQPVSHASVELSLAPDAPTDTVATVTVGARKATLMATLRGSTTLKHVRTGKATPLRVHWQDPDLAAHFSTLHVGDGTQHEVTLRPAPGGHVQWDSAPPSEAVVAWEGGASPYGDVAGRVALRREGTLWRTEEALRPGAYEAQLGDTPVRFVVRAGETVTAQPR